MQMCRLSEILNELLHIYDPLREFAKFGAQSRLEELGIRLEEIWAHIPQFLVCFLPSAQNCHWLPVIILNVPSSTVVGHLADWPK